MQKRDSGLEDVDGNNKIYGIFTYSNKDYEQLVSELDKVHKKVIYN